MGNDNLSWVERLDSGIIAPLTKTKEAASEDVLVKDKFNVHAVPSDGSQLISRELIFRAMKDSGFNRTNSCCNPKLEKMCVGDQYSGNLESFVNRLIKLL
jgi:hypothetical protein